MALSQTAVAIVCHATRRVAQNQPEQMFERPHVIEDPVRCGFLRAIVEQFDGFQCRLSCPGGMTGMATTERTAFGAPITNH